MSTQPTACVGIAPGPCRQLGEGTQQPFGPCAARLHGQTSTVADVRRVTVEVERPVQRSRCGSDRGGGGHLGILCGDERAIRHGPHRPILSCRDLVPAPVSTCRGGPRPSRSSSTRRISARSPRARGDLIGRGRRLGHRVLAPLAARVTPRVSAAASGDDVSSELPLERRCPGAEGSHSLGSGDGPPDCDGLPGERPQNDTDTSGDRTIGAALRCGSRTPQLRPHSANQ